jgi:two-component sensor histidine kinase
MTFEHLPSRADSPPNTIFEGPEHRTAANYERERTKHRDAEIRLRKSLAREEALLRQKDKLIQQQEVLRKESDHRLLNGLQMIVSLLSLQSRAASNVEAASQLAAARDRVATIGRVHRRLHDLDGVQTVAFKQYLEDLCGDFSAMLSSEERPEQAIVVEAIDVKRGPSLAFHSASSSTN